MHFSNVLLIHANFKTRHRYVFMPIGLGYIAEALSKNNIKYEIIDMFLDPSDCNLEIIIKTFKPDLIGVSMKTYMYKNGYKIIKKIKEIAPDLKIVVGGPHISTFREKALSECPEIDFGVMLEGDETIIELCKGNPFKDIKGLIFRNNGKIVINQNRDFLDINSISFPKYKGFDLEKYLFSEKVPIPICSSRGCPYQCIFCTVHSVMGRKYRYRNASNIVDEIEYWYSQGRRWFDFTDDNFTLKKERVYEICNEIERRNITNLRLSCTNGIRADKVDRELLKRMKEIGFWSVSIGVEAGNNKILEKIKKGERIEAIEESIKNACEVGLDVTLFFLFGSPYETWEDIQDSVSIAMKYPVRVVHFFNVTPYPDTELYEWVNKMNYSYYPSEIYLNSEIWTNKPLFTTPELSFSQRKRVMHYLKKIEKKVKEKYYKRVFNKWIFSSLIAYILSLNFMEKILSSKNVNKILHKVMIRM